MNIYLPLTLATRLELHTCIELTHSSDNVISCPKQLNDVLLICIPLSILLLGDCNAEMMQLLTMNSNALRYKYFLAHISVMIMCKINICIIMQ